MKAERWQQIDKLLERVLELEPGERRDFLDEACAGDEELRREVEALLGAHEQAGSLLSSPAFGIANQKSADSLRSLTGRTLSHYQILSRLGEGGMGIVYKARDTHLDRFVAIKVLPPALVADPERKRRFAQEAKAASALNHPNIITIHDIASDNGTEFIVMEYVQGKTLDQLIPRRGLKLNEVLKYAIQIADSLAKAHGSGIVHRDLKPGNIMASEGGLVKVLDFGLAKLVERPQVGEADSTGTLQTQTEEGMILGTASYMSPEQAAGKPVDTRSDIFSFGSVLYEMVTGQRAFQGDSKMSTLAAVLNQEPKPAIEISRTLPRDLEKIITRCLRKDPTRRFQGMADLRVALEELKEEFDSGVLAPAEAEGAGKVGRFPRSWWVALGLGIAIVATSWLWLRHLDTGQPDSSLTPVPLTSYPGWQYSPSFSPDGDQVAFAWSKPEADEDADIYIKQIGVEEPFRLTDGPERDVNPAWSPDGRSIAFGRYLSPERVAYIVKPQRGGPERTIAEFLVTGKVGIVFAQAACTWTADSKSLVVVGRATREGPNALFLVSVVTLEKHQLTDPPSRLNDLDPDVSPDGRALIFRRSDRSVAVDLYRLSLTGDSKAQGEPERITFDNRLSQSPTWTPDGQEILFVSGNTGFDLTLWRTSASKPGLPRRLAFAGPRLFRGLDVSRQRNRLAYSVSRGDTNIWRVELGESGVESREGAKIIASSQIDSDPAYAPDGKRIAFRSYRSGVPEIWLCDSDGSHSVQLTSFGGPVTNWPRWSPDGQQIAFYSGASRGSLDIYVTRADGGAPKQLTANTAVDTHPSWSADGKWIYFTSDRNGREQVWKVRADGGEATPVPQIPGREAVESPDGKFFYYVKAYGEENDSCLWRVPTDGGEETPVVDSLHPLGSQLVVMEDGIYFISKPDEKGVSYIRFKDLAKGEVRTIAPIRGQVYYGFTVSPDRRSFLYTQADDSGSDLMLVENFR
jgi:Tol biopolymer transport system component